MSDGIGLSIRTGAGSIDQLDFLRELATVDQSCRTPQQAVALMEKYRFYPVAFLSGQSGPVDALLAEAEEIRPYIVKLFRWLRGADTGEPYTESERALILERCQIEMADRDFGVRAPDVHTVHRVRGSVAWYALWWIARQGKQLRREKRTEKGYLLLCPYCALVLPIGRSAYCGRPDCKLNYDRDRRAEHRRHNVSQE